MADHRAELRLLHPGGAVGGCRADDRYAHDTQDLCLCMDGAYQLQDHEKRMRQRQVSAAGMRMSNARAPESRSEARGFYMQRFIKKSTPS